MLRAELGDRLDRAMLSFLTPDLAGGLFYPDNATQVSGVAFRHLGLTRVPAQAALGSDDRPELSCEALPEHAGDLMFAFTYDAEDQGGEFDRFLALPLVRALPVAQVGQVVEIDGTEAVGSAWGKVSALTRGRGAGPRGPAPRRRGGMTQLSQTETSMPFPHPGTAALALMLVPLPALAQDVPLTIEHKFGTTVIEQEPERVASLDFNGADRLMHGSMT